MRPVIAAIKLTAFFLWAFIAVLLQIPVLSIARMTGITSFIYIIPQLFHSVTCWIFKIHVQINGKISNTKQTVFISNHISYLDIPVLGSHIRASFIAKQDVAQWPLFGFLSKMQRTFYVSRNRVSVAQETAAIKSIFQGGTNLILFPEGTSSSGESVLPFHSSFFSLIIPKSPSSAETLLQPITLHIEETNGKAIKSQQDRDIYAWHGDMELAPHLWAFAKMSGAKLRLVFHPLITVKHTDNRKDLSQNTYRIIQDTFATLQNKV